MLMLISAPNERVSFHPKATQAESSKVTSQNERDACDGFSLTAALL